MCIDKPLNSKYHLLVWFFLFPETSVYNFILHFLFLFPLNLFICSFFYLSLQFLSHARVSFLYLLRLNTNATSSSKSSRISPGAIAAALLPRACLLEGLESCSHELLGFLNSFRRLGVCGCHRLAPLGTRQVYV